MPADQASRPQKRVDPEHYLQAVSVDLDPSDHAFFKGRQHVQYGAESAASEKHKQINKMHMLTAEGEMNRLPLSALDTHQAPCHPPRTYNPVSHLSSFLDPPYVVLPNENEEKRAPVHLPVLLNELQCVLSKHKVSGVQGRSVRAGRHA